MIDYTALLLLKRAATLIDGSYRWGLDTDDLPDKALFALHEATEIQTEVMRLGQISRVPIETVPDPGVALTQAADLLRDAVPHLANSQRLAVIGYELRLRRLAERVQP